MNSLKLFSEPVQSPSAAQMPRINSLMHRVLYAKDAERRPIALLDQLLDFVEDPPAGITDRWQAGADLCAQHGIRTSRMSIWRLYRQCVRLGRVRPSRLLAA